MDKNDKHITYLIEDALRKAINEVEGEQGVSKHGDEIHFKRIVFSGEHNLVVVEIGQEQQHDLPESFFENNETKQALLSHSNYSKVDVMDLDESTLIYFWTTSSEQSEKAEALNVAYVI